MDRGLLRGFERVAVPVMERINRSKRLKQVLHGSVGRFNCTWMTKATGVSWQACGFEAVRTLKAPQGIILVANHLSFFDMFVGSSLINGNTQLMKRVCYPVRANWHYQTPLGVVVNTAISGAAMWPPVFRDGERRPLNHTGVEQMVDFLGPGAAIGIHPEGRRNINDDPYSLLPLKPGLGVLLQRCHPDVMVVPFFIIGLSNSFGREATRWLRDEQDRGDPIRIRFAAPMRAGDVRQDRDAMAITEVVMAAVAEQGELDKAAIAASVHS